MDDYSFMSIRLYHRFSFRLGALGVVLILVGLAFRLLIGLPQLQEQIRESVAAQQTSAAAYLARDIDTEIRERRELTANLARAMPAMLIHRPAEASKWLREHQQLYPLFSKGLILARADGDGLIAEYPIVKGRAALDYSDKDWFIAGRRSTDAAIGAPYHGRASSEPLIVMAAPVRDTQGHTVAVLGTVSALNAPGFITLSNESTSASRLTVISARDRLLLASSEFRERLQTLPPTGVNMVYDKAISGVRGAYVAVNARGIEELSAAAIVPSTGWLVIAHQSTADAYHPVETLRSVFLHNTFVLIAVLFVAMMVAVPRMLLPLTRAAREMRRMANGEAPLHPLPIGRFDEVGEMAAGFNALLEKLQKQEAVLREHEARLAHMATHDPLTGLPNRALLEDRLGQALARAARTKSRVALLFCDLDGFKEVNDTHGHKVGDEVLREVANRLTDGRRRADTVARLGGDEFIILLPDLEDGRSAGRLVAELCLEALRKPIDVHGLSLKLGMSIGIALYPDAGTSASQLMACSDAAMYKAKRLGKGRYVFLETVVPLEELPERPALRVVKPDA
jgi:diguanylate cyclase (GGDEF)-like protein